VQLSIFPHYSFDLEILHGSVDGQKFETADPTIKARHSRKYFGRGKGVVAYTLLANHIPLQSQLIGAHEGVPIAGGHYGTRSIIVHLLSQPQPDPLFIPLQTR